MSEVIIERGILSLQHAKCSECSDLVKVRNKKGILEFKCSCTFNNLDVLTMLKKNNIQISHAICGNSINEFINNTMAYCNQCEHVLPKEIKFEQLKSLEILSLQKSLGSLEIADEQKDLSVGVRTRSMTKKSTDGITDRLTASQSFINLDDSPKKSPGIKINEMVYNVKLQAQLRQWGYPYD